MKRFFLSMLCVVSASMLFAQKPFKMEVSFKGAFDPGMAYIYISSDGVNTATTVTDSVAFKDGKSIPVKNARIEETKKK